ncbi:uncharacterized protein [Ptychodera flava]|uniref:uncharacterized protein n=1 Tax=Ptychodera flava TaxID=63121 RepID=UPI003969ED24
MVIRPPCKTFTVQLLSITMAWLIWKCIHLFGLFIIVQHLESAVTSMTSQPEGNGKTYHARVCSEFEVLQTLELQSQHNRANVSERLEVEVYLLLVNGNEQIKHQLVDENSSDCHLGYCIYYSYDGNKINVTFKINRIAPEDTGTYQMKVRLIDQSKVRLNESGKIVHQPSERFKIFVDGGDQGDKPTRDCADKHKAQHRQ